MPITNYYVASDAMGSVTAILDEDGNVFERRSYDAFGEMTCMLPDGTPVTESPTGVDVSFQGQIRDDATGIYQMGYRCYNPTLGRWLNRDPIGLIGGTNMQSFVGNRPIDSTDPDGLSPRCAPGYLPIKFTYTEFEANWGFLNCRVSVKHGGYCPKKAQDETLEMTIRMFKLKCKPCDNGNFTGPVIKVLKTEIHILCIPLNEIGQVTAVNPCKDNMEYDPANE